MEILFMVFMVIVSIMALFAVMVVFRDIVKEILDARRERDNAKHNTAPVVEPVKAPVVQPVVETPKEPEPVVELEPVAEPVVEPVEEPEVPTEEDELCARYIKSILEGSPIELADEIENLKVTSGAKFFDPDDPIFPEEDFWLSVEADKFDFVLHVEEGADGLMHTVKK